MKKGIVAPTSLNDGEQVELLLGRIAVAVDLVTATQVILNHGFLPQAMRATITRSPSTCPLIDLVEGECSARRRPPQSVCLSKLGVVERRRDAVAESRGSVAVTRDRHAPVAAADGHVDVSIPRVGLTASIGSAKRRAVRRRSSARSGRIDIAKRGGDGRAQVVEDAAAVVPELEVALIQPGGLDAARDDGRGNGTRHAPVTLDVQIAREGRLERVRDDDGERQGGQCCRPCAP